MNWSHGQTLSLKDVIIIYLFVFVKCLSTSQTVCSTKSSSCLLHHFLAFSGVWYMVDFKYLLNK